MAVAALLLATSMSQPSGTAPQRDRAFLASPEATPLTSVSKKEALPQKADLPVPQQFAAITSDLNASASERAHVALINQLVDIGCPCYPPDQVHAFLRGEAASVGQTYVWVPMKADAGSRPVWKEKEIINNRGYGIFVDGVYTKAVPDEVSQLASRISGYVPGVQCFISDIGNYPDPFLGVGVSGQALVVVAQWDLPGQKVPLKQKPHLLAFLK
ncbi:hypothetical protein HZA45_00260 [Candidatus Peregrinibacteria bacterium]|nr:hypothetical protein [Candidatus Peregrinibacteria bacterium]